MRLRVAREPARLRIEVEDDGPGPGSSTHRGSGTAMANLRERLRLIYGGRARLDLKPAGADGGCLALLQLPLAGGEERS